MDCTVHGAAESDTTERPLLSRFTHCFWDSHGGGADQWFFSVTM